MNDELYKVYFWYLDSGTCFGFWEVCSDSGKCFGFWDVFLDSGKCFGFWEVFWILGRVFGFWEVFWILGRVLDSGKCFGFWEVFCPYEPPYKEPQLHFFCSELYQIPHRENIFMFITQGGLVLQRNQSW